MSGGISRFKQHLAWVRRNCAPCPKVSDEVRKKAEATIETLKVSQKLKKDRKRANLEDVQVGHPHDSLDDDISMSSDCGATTRGPMDHFFQNAEKATGGKGKTLGNVDNKARQKKRDDTNGYIARWVYEKGIPLDAIDCDSFRQMVHAIGLYGPWLNPPTSYEIRYKYLQTEVGRIKASLETFSTSCKVNGCSLLTDAWSDRKSRSIMNLMLHSGKRTAFWKSKNVSSSVHDANFIYNFVDEALDSEDGPGAENVVQIVTDNASSNMAAAKMLLLKRPNIFWTSCGAHTLNLLLGDIGRQKNIKSACDKARTFTNFIYNHTIPLDMMREACKDLDSKDISRAGATRFASSFLNLQSILSKKRNLREMFVSEKWHNTRISSTPLAKKVSGYILSAKFWRDVELSVAVFAPLVKVLRRSDSDHPSMGWLYGDMLKAKEEVAVALENDQSKYQPIWTLIDNRVAAKMSSPLHLAGYFLNPIFYYPNRASIAKDGKFIKGFLECSVRMYDEDVQGNITTQLLEYQHQEGDFGKPAAHKFLKRADFDPVAWWNLYGTSTPELKVMAMRLLSLTTSSSACERNWSTFEMIHTKKRNRLQIKRLNDLVFVQYNSRLSANNNERKKDQLVSRFENLDAEDETEDEVFRGEGLTWKQIGELVDEDDVASRRPSRPTSSKKNTSTSKGKRKAPSEEEICSSSSSEDENIEVEEDYATEEDEVN